MAATGFTPVYLYYSATASNIPDAGNLGYGELAINIADGKLFYKDNANVVQVIATKDAASGSFTSITDSGNLTFTGTGNRITGDFSNATHSNRVIFQSSTLNGRTELGVLPNGTSTNAAINLYASNDADNSSTIRLSTTTTDMRIVSGQTGTGSYVPMSFYTNNAPRLYLNTAGLATFGYSAAFGAALSSTNAAFLQTAASTYTDTATAASGTVTFGGFTNHLAPTLAATNASVTYSNAANMYIGGAPTAGSNVTITNAYSLYVGSGTSYFGSNVGIGKTGSTVPIHTALNSSVQAIFEQTGGTQNFIVLRNTGSTGNNIRVTADNTDLTLYTAGAEKLRLFNSGGLSLGNTTDPGSTNLSVTGTGKFGTTVGVGAATPAASGVGVTFPSTQSLSTDVNTLDDYREGTFTATGTGFSDATPPSGTARYVKVGNMVMISLPQLVGTSNATTFTVTGMPTEIRPSANRYTIAQARDNGGAFVAARAIPQADGTITLYKNLDNGAWTASGSKILNECMINYII